MRLMSRRASPIVLTPEEQSTLETWARGRSIAARLVQRAEIIRMAAPAHAEPRHRRTVERFATDGATVAAALLGASSDRVGKRCSAAGSLAADFCEKNKSRR